MNCYICKVETDGKCKIDGRVVCERHFNAHLIEKAKEQAAAGGIQTTRKVSAKYPIKAGELVRFDADGLAIPMRRFVFIDTETSGLPDNYNLPAYKTRNWPRIVQIAIIIWWAEEVREGCHLIKPEGWEIPESATEIHGISQDRALREGTPISELLPSLAEELREPGTALVAHNVDFDARVLGAEFIRHGIKEEMMPATDIFEVNEGMPMSPACVVQQICTMKQSTDFCRLPGKWKDCYKWPNLQELHETLFGERFSGAHDALSDVRACMKCFLELWKKGVIDA